MNELMTAKVQTPIEIALGVDDEGMTTAKKLYEFLELDKSHYKRWVNKNIINNLFVEENVDYISIRPKGENRLGGRPTYDYRISAKLAKSLSLESKSLRRQEVVEYFTGTETALKKVAKRKADEITKLKASYYDMENLLKRSQQELSQLRQQFIALEERQEAKDSQQYEKSYEAKVAREFLHIIKDVISSDEHSIAIKPKCYHGSLTLVGIYDDTHIYLGKELAYNIYEQYAKRPVKAKLLWEILTQTGYVDVMCTTSRKMMIGWCSQAPLVLYRDQVEFLIMDKV